MRRQTTWRLQNNPLHIDLFERSSQSPDTIETSFTVKPIEPVEMARNGEENIRKRFIDYAKPVLQRLVSRIHALLNRGAHFRIDSYVMSMFLIFHDKPSEDRIYAQMNLAKYVKSIIFRMSPPT